MNFPPDSFGLGDCGAAGLREKFFFFKKEENKIKGKELCPFGADEIELIFFFFFFSVCYLESCIIILLPGVLWSCGPRPIAPRPIVVTPPKPRKRARKKNRESSTFVLVNFHHHHPTYRYFIDLFVISSWRRVKYCPESFWAGADQLDLGQGREKLSLLTISHQPAPFAMNAKCQGARPTPVLLLLSPSPPKVIAGLGQATDSKCWTLL